MIPAARCRPRSAPARARLNLVVRPGYADEAWVTAFQDETGCIVTSRVAATSDEMVQLMHTGPVRRRLGLGRRVDAVVIVAGDAAPVNVDLIRSYPDLSGFLKDQPDNTYQGRTTASRTAGARTC